MRTISIGFLNIAMPKPHSPDRYVDLIRMAFRSRTPIDLRQDHKGLLGSVRVNSGLVTGQIYKYFDLDPSSNWFDVEKQQAADAADIALIQIPTNLKPHMQIFDYAFFPSKHRLAFICKEKRDSFPPRMAGKFFEGLFERDQIQRKFGRVEVTVEPRREQLELILAIPSLRRLQIEIVPPNAEDLGSIEDEVMERLASQGADRLSVDLSTRNPEGLKPDDGSIALAKVAQSNGRVTGRGVAESGTVVELSTADHPLTVAAHYDPASEFREAAMINAAQEAIKTLR